MTFSTEFVDEGHGVILTASGIFTGKELIGTKWSILEAIQKGMPVDYAFVDLSDINRFSVDSDDIQEAAHIDMAMAQTIGKIPVAIVAPSDIAFGMARMWEAYVQKTNWDTCVFRDRIKALSWLAAQGHAINFEEEPTSKEVLHLDLEDMNHLRNE